MTRKTRLVWGVGAVGAMALAAAPAWAQEDGATLDEIVVTAQKRSERLQDVPLSITALTQEQIEKRGMDQFTDYARTIPGLSFIDRGPGRNKITLRGVSTGTDQNHQSPVGVYIDEMPVSYPNNEPDLRLFDVERVEVLRGPQGTLYGAGSMGGTIKIITAKPDLGGVSGKINLIGSSTNEGDGNFAANGMVNLPIATDKAAVRAVAYYRKDSGWVDNVQLGQEDVNEDETWGARLSAKFQLSDSLDLTLTGMVQRTELGGTQEVDPALGELQQARAVPETRSDELEVYNATFNWDLGWASLVSSSSYLDRMVDDTRDVTAFLGVPVAVWLVNGIPDTAFAQEFRLVSNPGGRIEWLLGAFYSDRDGGLNQNAKHAGLFGLPTTTDLLVSRITQTEKQMALFGELGWNVTDRLKITGGLRAFKVKQTFHKVSDGLIAGGFSEDSGDSSETKLNPKFNVSFKATPDILLYAQAAQGFRVGGPNTTVPPLNGVAAPSTYNSDSLWNYEAGAKTAWFDGRLTLNAALFYIDWSDIQVTFTRTDGFSYIVNGDTAVSKGLELEVAARPVEGLEVGASLAYVKAELTADSQSGVGKNGDEIPAVPHLTWNLYGRYTHPLGDGLDGFVQADIQHVGHSYNGFKSGPVAPDLQHGYEITNLKVGIEAEAWEISLFANNLFDERAELYVDRTLGDRRINVNRPRTIGVNVSKNF